MNELSYRTVGEVQIPEMSLKETSPTPLGRYGRMRKTYLQEQRPILWTRLLLSETLYSHLHEIEEAAQSRLTEMMPVLMKSAGVTEQMKAEDPMKWTGLMNSLKAQAEEIILRELIYS